MENSKDLQRNRPAEKGSGNDPNVRDEDASQPGMNTISSSDTDEANQQLTRTTSDSFREEKKDERADRRFDD